MKYNSLNITIATIIIGEKLRMVSNSNHSINLLFSLNNFVFTPQYTLTLFAHSNANLFHLQLLNLTFFKYLEYFQLKTNYIKFF